MGDRDDEIDVLLGDPATGSLEAARFPAGSEAFLAACRAFVGCPYMEEARLEGLAEGVGRVVAVVDEEGLLKSQGGFWRLAGSSRGYAGRVVLVGVGEGGEPASLADGGAAVRAVVEMHAARLWLSPDDADAAAEGGVRLVLERTR